MDRGVGRGGLFRRNWGVAEDIKRTILKTKRGGKGLKKRQGEKDNQRLLCLGGMGGTAWEGGGTRRRTRPQRQLWGVKYVQMGGVEIGI